MSALTIDNGEYAVPELHTHSECGDIPSFPFSPGVPGVPSLPGLHSTGTTIVPPGSPCSPSAPSLTNSIHPSSSPGMFADDESWSLSFQIHVHPTPSWSGYLTMSRYVYDLTDLQSSLGVGDSPSSPSCHLGIVRFNALIVGLSTVMLAAAAHHDVTSPISRSTVSPFGHFHPGCPSSQLRPFAHAGIWNVMS